MTLLLLNDWLQEKVVSNSAKSKIHPAHDLFINITCFECRNIAVLFI